MPFICDEEPTADGKPQKLAQKKTPPQLTAYGGNVNGTFRKRFY